MGLCWIVTARPIRVFVLSRLTHARRCACPAGCRARAHAGRQATRQAGTPPGPVGMGEESPADITTFKGAVGPLCFCPMPVGGLTTDAAARRETAGANSTSKSLPFFWGGTGRTMCCRAEHPSPLSALRIAKGRCPTNWQFAWLSQHLANFVLERFM